PWEAIAAYATRLHTEKKETKRSPTPSLSPVGGEGARRASEGVARTYKTPEQLESYSRKRKFDKTPEPPLPPLAPSDRERDGVRGTGSAFVVHRHHASRLHYDLRLEQNGVLKSWAVPKGLPPRLGIMRLAVNVEDHPLEYFK